MLQRDKVLLYYLKKNPGEKLAQCRAGHLNSCQSFSLLNYTYAQLLYKITPFDVLGVCSLLQCNYCVVKSLSFLVWEIQQGSLELGFGLPDGTCSAQTVHCHCHPPPPSVTCFPRSKGRTLYLLLRLRKLNNFPFLFSFFSSFFFFPPGIPPLLLDREIQNLLIIPTKSCHSLPPFLVSHACAQSGRATF